MAKPLNRHFSKKDTKIAIKHIKMFNITSHERIANQNHMRHPFATIRMALDKKTDNNKCW